MKIFAYGVAVYPTYAFFSKALSSCRIAPIDCRWGDIGIVFAGLVGLDPSC